MNQQQEYHKKALDILEDAKRNRTWLSQEVGITNNYLYQQAGEKALAVAAYLSDLPIDLDKIGDVPEFVHSHIKKAFAMAKVLDQLKKS